MVLAASARCGGLFEGLLALKSRSLGLGGDGGLFVPDLGGGPRQTRTGAHYRAVPPNCHCLKVQEAGNKHIWSLRSPTSPSGSVRTDASSSCRSGKTKPDREDRARVWLRGQDLNL